MDCKYDVTIVGGGIIGLATAMAWLARAPGSSLVVLEKEAQVGVHQTGHNSGVIHSGIYYRPGSLKAKTCVEGARLLVEFCRARQIPYHLCGKLVVATEGSELPALETLYQRGCANGVSGLRLLAPEQFREIEPHARGIRALHVPQAGIVDYGAVARAMADVVRERGGDIRTSARVHHLERRDGVWVLETQAGDFHSKYLVTCGGLQADRVAAKAGATEDMRIVPFRGEYYDLAPERRFLVKAMIYPVPNPALPFLGVHFTRTMHGSVHAGPNAVLALKREGYRKRDVSVRDVWDMVSYKGFWKMAARHWLTGLGECYRSWNTRAFVSALQRLVPEVRPCDFSDGGSGVRAQAVDPRGTLLDDFSIVQGVQGIYVRNVPSPAATASIRIGQLIADMAASAFTPPLR